MNIVLVRDAGFEDDLAAQYLWYEDQAGSEVAERFFAEVTSTLNRLKTNPESGRSRSFRISKLRGLRSILLGRPYNRFIIFYRYNEPAIEIWRMLDGSRDL